MPGAHLPCASHPGESHPDLGLGEDDAAEDEGQAEEVHRTEGLTEEDDAEDGARDGVEQADDGDRSGAHRREALEPRDVGDAGADDLAAFCIAFEYACLLNRDGKDRIYISRTRQPGCRDGKRFV